MGKLDAKDHMVQFRAPEKIVINARNRAADQGMNISVVMRILLTAFSRGELEISARDHG